MSLQIPATPKRIEGKEATMPQTATKVRTEDSQRPEMTQLAGRDAVTSRLRRRKAALDEATEELLDAIDDVLAETDALAFVAQFRQKGGQ